MVMMEGRDNRTGVRTMIGNDQLTFAMDDAGGKVASPICLPDNLLLLKTPSPIKEKEDLMP